MQNKKSTMTSYKYYIFVILVGIMSLKTYSITQIPNIAREGTQSIIRLDLSNDSTMMRIMEDVTDPVKYGSHTIYYSVNMTKYKDGILLRINRFKNPVFDPRLEPVGFIECNGQLIVFNLSLDYDFSFSNDKDYIEINTGILNDRTDVLGNRYYYILGNIFARFSPETGWIWSDGKPDI